MGYPSKNNSEFVLRRTKCGESFMVGLKNIAKITDQTRPPVNPFGLNNLKRGEVSVTLWLENYSKFGFEVVSKVVDLGKMNIFAEHNPHFSSRWNNFLRSEEHLISIEFFWQIWLFFDFFVKFSMAGCYLIFIYSTFYHTWLYEKVKLWTNIFHWQEKATSSCPWRVYLFLLNKNKSLLTVQTRAKDKFAGR